MKYGWLILALCVVGCDQGFQYVPPTAPTATRPATPEACFSLPTELVVACDQAYLRAVDEPLTLDLQASGTTWAITGQAENLGTRCAIHVQGTTTFYDGSHRELLTLPWTLDPAVQIAPTARAAYRLCCGNVSVLASAQTFRTAFRFDSAICP